MTWAKPRQSTGVPLAAIDRRTEGGAAVPLHQALGRFSPEWAPPVVSMRLAPSLGTSATRVHGAGSSRSVNQRPPRMLPRALSLKLRYHAGVLWMTTGINRVERRMPSPTLTVVRPVL